MRETSEARRTGERGWFVVERAGARVETGRCRCRCKGDTWGVYSSRVGVF